MSKRKFVTGDNSTRTVNISTLIVGIGVFFQIKDMSPEKYEAATYYFTEEEAKFIHKELGKCLKEFPKESD